MVSILARMHRLRSMLALRVGPGAAILPPEVARIHMEFPKELKGGNTGSKKFWKNCLPRLKYYNPAIPMTIRRTDKIEDPATMTITFRQPTHTSESPSKSKSTTSESQTSAGEADIRIEVINTKHRVTMDIVNELLRVTKAKVVQPTQEELQQIKEIQAQNVIVEKMTLENAERRAIMLRERELLKKARGEVDATM